MKNSNKDVNLKGKLKQALGSTIRVISEDFIISNKKTEIRNTKKFDSFEIEKLDTDVDFIKARADADSSALKKKFSRFLFDKRFELLKVPLTLWPFS